MIRVGAPIILRFFGRDFGGIPAAHPSPSLPRLADCSRPITLDTGLGNLPNETCRQNQTVPRIVGSCFPAMPSRVGATTDRAAQCAPRSEEHTSELQSHLNLVCRLLLEKKKRSHPTS